MYGQPDFAPSYGPSAAALHSQAHHRFNPNAPAFRMGPAAAAHPYDAPYGAADYQQQGAPMHMNAALLADQQHYQQQPRPAVHHHAQEQPSFGSSNTSFSGPSTPAMGGQPASNPKRRRHNPYASSNASTSEPSTPVVGPAAAARVPPAADSYFNGSMSSANTSTVQSPVYATDASMGGGSASGALYDAAANHPIAYSINEQFVQARGTLAAAACTPRGRHMLVGALRQQHTDKIQAIFEELAPAVAAVVMDPQGGHVIRTLVEFLSEQQVAGLVDYMTPEVVLTIATSSQNTRRVLQTLFERHRGAVLQPVVDVIGTHAIALSTTQQGCIAVMRCLEHAADVQKHQVLASLTPQLAALTMDPYGNYVVQAVLQYFPRDVSCEVIEKAFAGHWINLSCNKFASNVMEKFIQAATPMTRKAILDELIFNTDALGTLMQDGFGNFVLQQIIDTCTTGPEYRKLTEKVRPMLGGSPFGHKIEAKLKSKRFGPPYEGGRENAQAASNANRQPGPRPKKDGAAVSTGPDGRRSRGKPHGSTAEHGSHGPLGVEVGAKDAVPSSRSTSSASV